MSRKVVLYIAMSLDGYIAKPNDDLSFLSIVEKDGEDYGYVAFLQTVDTVIVGRRTYDWVLANVPAYPHTDKQCFVVTRTHRPKIDNVTFYNGSLSELVHQLKAENGQDIYCDGGAEIVNELLQADLIDEFILSVIPILVGSGTKLFKDNRPELRLQLVGSKQFEKGLVQLHYKRLHEKEG
jgi:dihydrofolate reductase